MSGGFYYVACGIKKQSFSSIRMRIQNDILTLMRKRDPRSTVLKQVISEIVRAEKSGKEPLTMQLESKVVRKCVERWKSAILEYGGLLEKYPDDSRIQQTIRKETDELELIESYLLDGLDESEIDEIVRDAINLVKQSEVFLKSNGDKKMAINMVMRHIRENIDCSRIPSMSDIVNKILRLL